MPTKDRTRISLSFAGIAFASLAFIGSSANADVIASTDFTGRTVSGATASNITWTTLGVIDPGSLTAVDINSADGSPPFDLWNTANAQGHFAPDLNTDNEGPWETTIALSLTTASLDLVDVVLDWQHFNNSGAFQSAGINRPTDWTAEVIGSSSLLVGSVTGNTGSGGSGILTLTFASPVTLSNSETWDLVLTADGTTTTGNNTGLDALTINGTLSTVVPEPTTFALTAIGLLSLGMIGWRRRRQA